MLKQKQFALLLSLITCTLIGACADRVRLGEEAVARFRVQMAEARFSQICEEASEELKEALGDRECIPLIQTMAEKMGSYQSSKRQGMVVKTLLKGNYIQIIYSTQFSNGKGTEYFKFRIESDNAILVGYRIDSPLLSDLSGD